MKGIFKKTLHLSALGLLAMASSQAFASGYKLEFQSPSVLADAGDAAVVEDAGTNWYNSAGLIRLPQQLVVGSNALIESTTFTGTAMAPSVFGPAFSFAGAGSASSHPSPFIPAIHYNMPFLNRYAIGVSLVPAWGLVEDYGENALTRYDLTRIYTRTIDIAPSFAMKVNNKWSFGLGPDFNYFMLSTKNLVRTEGPIALGGTAGDSISRSTGQNWGYGWHAGLLFAPDPMTRVGLNYRSKISMHIKGYSDFSASFGTFETNQFQLNLVHPPTTTLSVYRDLNPRWAVMGTLAYDQWSTLRNYNAQNFQSVPTAGNPMGTVNVILPQNMHNTLDASIGAHYKYNDAMMLRGSFKYEGAPTNTAFRDINNPDAPKYGINLGARLQLAKKVAVDVMYGHVFTPTVGINNTNPVTLASISGTSRTSIDILGMQIVWDI